MKHWLAVLLAVALGMLCVAPTLADTQPDIRANGISLALATPSAAVTVPFNFGYQLQHWQIVTGATVNASTRLIFENSGDGGTTWHGAPVVQYSSGTGTSTVSQGGIPAGTTFAPAANQTYDFWVPTPAETQTRVRVSTNFAGNTAATVAYDLSTQPWAPGILQSAASQLTVALPTPLPVSPSTSFPVTAATTIPVSAATTLPVSIATTVPVSLATPVQVSTPAAGFSVNQGTSPWAVTTPAPAPTGASGAVKTEGGGTAGSPAGGVNSVQGVTSGTPVTVATPSAGFPVNPPAAAAGFAGQHVYPANQSGGGCAGLTAATGGSQISRVPIAPVTVTPSESTTQFAAATSNLVWHVCGVWISPTAALTTTGSITVSTGTGTNCGTGNVVIFQINLPATAWILPIGNGEQGLFDSASSGELCVASTGFAGGNVTLSFPAAAHY